MATRAARLEELLNAYQDVLDVVELAPPVVFVRRSWRPVVRRLRRPRPTWYLRLLLRQHVARRVEKLCRVYSARVALDPTNESLAAERRLIKTFSESLPPLAVQRTRLILAVAIFVLARFAARLVTLPDDDGRKAFDSISSLMSPDVKNVGDALDTLLSASPQALLLLSLALAAGAYVVLRALVPPFRLKRITLNQRLRPTDGFRNAVTMGSATRSTGVYELEAEVMRELGARPLREFPIDLFATLLSLYALIFLGGAFWWEGASWNDPTETQVGMSLVGIGLARLVFLAWEWWRRSRVWRAGDHDTIEERPPMPLAPVAASP